VIFLPLTATTGVCLDVAVRATGRQERVWSEGAR
jgi:hypothetical protein